MDKNHCFFRTRSGYCHILKDKIIISRHKEISPEKTEKLSRLSLRPAYIDVFIAIVMIILAFLNFQYQQLSSTIIFSVMAVFFIYSIVTGWDIIKMNVIQRKEIIETKFVDEKFIVFLPKVYFYIEYQGKKRKVEVPLMNKFLGGKDLKEAVLRILGEEKFIAHN